MLFSYGQSGWHCGIKKVCGTENVCKHPKTFEIDEIPNIWNVCYCDGYLEMEYDILDKGKQKWNIVSIREYYCYKLQMRDDEGDEILHTGRIFQQYTIDEYIKLEI